MVMSAVNGVGTPWAPGIDETGNEKSLVSGSCARAGETPTINAKATSRAVWRMTLLACDIT
jgi:hypothetical protein